jgi:hypothetical protein
MEFGKFSTFGPGSWIFSPEVWLLALTFVQFGMAAFQGNQFNLNSHNPVYLSTLSPLQKELHICSGFFFFNKPIE